jgi:hypothetical protein
MTTRNRFKITIILLVLPFFGKAQVILLEPENAVIKKDLIVPSHDFYKVIIFDVLGNKQAEVMNESTTQIDSLQGNIIFTRFRQYPFGAHHTDTSIARLKNLQPLVLKEFYQPSLKSLDIKFNEKSVIAHAIIKGIEKDTVYNFKEGYYDDNTIENFLGYFKLEKGKKYRLNSYRYESSGSNPYEFEFLFDDILTGTNSSIIKCEVIQFANGYINGYLWYEKQTGRLIKEIGVMKTGSFLIFAS